MIKSFLKNFNLLLSITLLTSFSISGISLCIEKNEFYFYVLTSLLILNVGLSVWSFLDTNLVEKFKNDVLHTFVIEVKIDAEEN